MARQAYKKKAYSLAFAKGRPIYLRCMIPSKRAKNLMKKPIRPRLAEPFNRYIHSVMNRACPKRQISSNALSVMDSFLYDAFEKIANEAADLVHFRKVATLNGNHIRTATKLLLRGGLGDEIIAKADKALQTYELYKT